MLDLFSGSGSVGNYFREKGYEVMSLDIDPKTNPTICMDVLNWNFREMPSGFFHVIAASVPCTE